MVLQLIDTKQYVTNSLPLRHCVAILGSMVSKYMGYTIFFIFPSGIAFIKTKKMNKNDMRLL